MSSAPVRDPLSDHLIAPDVLERGLLIGGNSVSASSGKQADDISPWDGEIYACVAAGTPPDIARAADAAQSTKNMEYVRLLLKHKQPGFSATLELAAELAGRELRKPEIPREVIRISDAGSHARPRACDPAAATAGADSLRIFR